MGLQDFVGLAGVPVIVAIVAWVKAVVPELKPRWLPVVALGASLVINYVVAWRMDIDYVLAGLVAVVASLAASGLYGQARALAGK